MSFICKSQYRKAFLLFSLFLWIGIFTFTKVYAQFYGGNFFRQSKEGIVIQGSINEKLNQGKVYVHLEAYPIGKVRIDFVQLKDSKGNIYQPVSLRTIPKDYSERGWIESLNLIPRTLSRIFSLPQSFAICDRCCEGPSSQTPLLSQGTHQGPHHFHSVLTVTLCTFDVPKDTQGPFSVVAGVSLVGLPAYVTSQVVFDTSQESSLGGAYSTQDDCCEFRSINIQNIWDERKNLEVTLTSDLGPQTQVITAFSSYNFKGKLGKCLRIIVKSTESQDLHSLIEDVNLCCRDLKAGNFPRFLNLRITDFSSQACKEEEPLGVSVPQEP